MAEPGDEEENFAANDDPEPFDQDDEDEDATPTTGCPYCGQEIDEQAEFCHHCGKYISEDDRAPSRPLWYSIGVILCVLIVLLGALGYGLMRWMR